MMIDKAVFDTLVDRAMAMDGFSRLRIGILKTL